MSQTFSDEMHSMPTPMEALTETLVDVLRCDICGVTGGRRGQAFRNLRDLKTHKAHAHRTAPRNRVVPNRQGMQQPIETQQPVSHVHFCPQCGCNLAVVNAALGLMQNQR